MQVSVYGLCGDTIGTLLGANPAAATVEDNIGRLPLHVAVDCESPWLKVVDSLIKAYPRACRERDGKFLFRFMISLVHRGLLLCIGGGRVPLHIGTHVHRYLIFYT